MNTDVLIIGGGCGGLDTAIQLRQHARDIAIALVNPAPYLVYRPWLISLPVQRRSFEALQVSLQKAAAAYQLRLITDTVTRLDLAQHQAWLGGGEPISYRSVVLATGAPADRARLAGAAEHALFPCDVDDALALQQRFLALKEGNVTIILSGERPGPGLEYAGYLAAAMHERGLTDRLQVHVVDDQDCLQALFGSHALELIGRLFAQKGARLIMGQAVRAIHADGVELENETAWPTALTAVVGPLRGVDVGLAAPVIDAQGFVQVHTTFQSVEQPDLFAVGDAARLPPGDELPKSWVITRKQAETAARNLLAHIRGHDLRPLDIARIHKGPLTMSMPDIGGQTVVVKNRRVLARGRWPLLLRRLVDRRYLKARS
jgi:NADH:ubiquinone reductase (H+-translocating)